MNFIASTNSAAINMENRLRFWLTMDEWGIDEATQIISGLDPDKTIKPSTNGNIHSLGSVTLFNGRKIPAPDLEMCGCGKDDCNDCANQEEGISEAQDELNELNAYFLKCKDMARLFNSPSNNSISPKEWIERALSKKISIPWLRLAIERGLLPKDLAEKIGPVKQNNATKEKPLTTTERNTLLTIIAALCDDSVINPSDRSSASLIAKMTEDFGAPVTDETVRNVLSKIPDALQSRMRIEKREKSTKMK